MPDDNKQPAEPAPPEQNRKTGILLVNLGSPDAPTPGAVRKYLAQFLGDPRVIEANRFIWWFALHGVILRIRPPRAAKSYQKVWTEKGSPLISISQDQTTAIRSLMQQHHSSNIHIELAMTYGNPSIPDALQRLQNAGAHRLLVLPLYPQYSATTTAAVFDQITSELQNWRRLPECRFINQYYDQPAHIQALANSITKQWQNHQRAEKLLFSFHGLPQRYVDNGDPYFEQCQHTCQLVADTLKLKSSEWQLVFQSRFGREAWLQPYCSLTLEELGKNGTKSVDVICPGFAADCLETLEEISMENKEIFINAGGETFNYIPCLNADNEHIEALTQLLEEHLCGWNAPYTV